MDQQDVQLQHIKPYTLKFWLFMLLKIHPSPCHLYVDWGQRNLSRLVYCQRDAYYAIN